MDAIALNGVGATAAIGQSYTLVKENLAPCFVTEGPTDDQSAAKQ